MQYFWGAIVGATLLTMLPIWFQFLEDYYQITYGLLFVVLLLVALMEFAPDSPAMP